MKVMKLTYGLMAASMLTLASCNLNDYPEFDNADAFVAIQQTSASISETGDTLSIPVMLTSLGGMNGSVDFEITPDSVAGAQEGVHYTVLNSSKTLTFTPDQPTQEIKLKIVDNDEFGGDVKMNVKLVNAQGVQLGANKICQVTIEDDEHPLSFILGTLNAKGISYFNDEQEWEVTFAKDADDLSKVWIYNLVPGGSSSTSPVYGIVNEEKTEIHIPVGQEIAKSSSYPKILLEGYYGDHSAFGIEDEHTADGEEDIPNGGFITGLIAADGTITLIDWFGSHVYSDDAATASAGWYNILETGIVLKK